MPAARPLRPDTGNRCGSITVSRAMTHLRLGLDGQRPSRPTRLLAPTLLLALAATACAPAAAPTATPGGSGSPSGSPSTPGASPTPTAVAGIQHPTGPKDVILRFESGGGLVPMEWSTTYAPTFNLYGDGTVVFRDPNAPPLDQGGNIALTSPFMVTNIGEAGIQALLAEALGPGGIGIAEGPYEGMGADIPTATFSIDADGQKKQVSVSGLSPDMHPQNAAVVTALAAFAEKLRLFGDSVNGESPYIPAGYRGTLITMDQPFGPVIDWPWPDVSPDDFGGENEFFQTRTMSQAEVEATGLKQITGGMHGLTLRFEGKHYSFTLRPLLPDETE